MKHTKASIAKMVATRKRNRLAKQNSRSEVVVHEAPFLRAMPLDALSPTGRANLDALAELVVAVWRRI